MYTWIPINTSDDLATLEKHISFEYAPQVVSQRLSENLSSAIKSVLIEHNYIDKDYRSTYYNFYAKKGQSYRADCVRLHFFDETVTYDSNLLKLACPDNKLSHHYFGYMVLRPTGIATIGRSVLSPTVRKGASGFIITADHKVHLLGHKLIATGFPSMDQHVDISVCAHAACWSILRHYSEKFNIYREFHTHDITLMAQHFNPGGLVPSKGLEVSHAERVLQAAGTFPVLVSSTASTTDPDLPFYRQLSAYVDSGFPLFAAMHSESHAIAVVGYDWKKSTATTKAGMRFAWDEIESLVVIDDNYLPYLSVPKTTGKLYSVNDIDTFLVALPEKIFYPADAVDQLAPKIFKLTLIKLPEKDGTIIRYFVTTGSALRRFMRDRESEFDPELIKTVMSLPFAQFIWVVEYSSESEWAAGQISARVVIDATASLLEDAPFWLIHDREHALIFDRKNVNAPPASGMKTLTLDGMSKTALTRMDQNLTHTKAR